MMVGGAEQFPVRSRLSVALTEKGIVLQLSFIQNTMLFYYSINSEY